MGEILAAESLMGGGECRFLHKQTQSGGGLGFASDYDVELEPVSFS